MFPVFSSQFDEWLHLKILHSVFGLQNLRNRVHYVCGCGNSCDRIAILHKYKYRSNKYHYQNSWFYNCNTWWRLFFLLRVAGLFLLPVLMFTLENKIFCEVLNCSHSLSGKRHIMMINIGIPCEVIFQHKLIYLSVTVT